MVLLPRSDFFLRLAWGFGAKKLPEEPAPHYVTQTLFWPVTQHF